MGGRRPPLTPDLPVLTGRKAVILAASSPVRGSVRRGSRMSPTKHEQRGAHGAASSTHYLGTATAMAVLARGGNAFDAAVAAGFVLQVVEPHLCGPGGEVPAVFVTASDPTPRVLCAQGWRPAAATTALLRDELGLTVVPGTGLLAAGRPRLVGRLADAPARPRHDDAGRGARTGRSATRRTGSRWSRASRRRSRPSPITSARTGPAPPPPGCPAGRCRRPSTGCRCWRPPGSGCSTPPRRRAATGSAQIDAARDAWYRGFVAEEVDAVQQDPGARRDRP